MYIMLKKLKRDMMHISIKITFVSLLWETHLVTLYIRWSYELILNTYKIMDLLCNYILFWKIPTLTAIE